MDKFDKDFAEKYPLCYATGTFGSEMNEADLRDKLSLNEQVELKIKTGIALTIREEQFCLLSYDLPGEIWKPIAGTNNNYYISNRRRIRGTKGIIKQDKFGGFNVHIAGYSTRHSAGKLVSDYFYFTDIKYNEPMQTSITKVLTKQLLTPEDIDALTVNIDIPGEEWRPVVGYEGRYEVSNLGRVKSLLLDSVMSTAPSHGYRQVLMCGSERRDTKEVHRLVAEAFIPKTEEDIRLNRNEVNHKNGNKMDNRVENLEWVRHDENLIHAVDTGLYNCRHLTKEQIEQLIHMFDIDKLSIRAILNHPDFKDIGIQPSALYNAIWRKTYKSYDIPAPSHRQKGCRGRLHKK